ncbi:MAG: hypothetical protein UZ07_CHB004000402 [Chlorobi bacterium OLB7]|nr:MAG: hypothetical protein UZ07_CHB004000402 [Chlorobi bacterium OLB7]
MLARTHFPNSKLQGVGSSSISFLYRLAIGLVAMVIAVATATAQSNPCPDPTCPNSSWSGVSVFPVRFDLYGHCNGCTGKIYIRTRNCGTCDIYVEKIDMDDVNCTCAAGDMFKSAIADLFITYLDYLPLNCRPGKGECETNWRVLIGGCYEFITSPTQVASYQHCPGPGFLSDCCTSEYKICKGTDGTVTFEQIGETSTTVTCTPPCQSYCGYIPVHSPTSAKREAPWTAPEVAEVVVAPNPTNGKTIIRCTAVAVPEAVVDIVDLQGNIVATQRGVTTADKTLEVEFNASDVAAGTYHYRVSATGSNLPPDRSP